MSTQRPSISVHIRENVLQALWEFIASHPPERGGFLFGTYAAGVCFVEHFIYDAHAQVSGAIFTPSREATSNAAQTCSKTGLSFLGVVHSHPAGLDRPSDMIAMNSVLALNTHMPYVLTPIISACYSSIKPHEIMFNNSSKSPKISFFLKWREDSNLVKAQEAKQIAAGPSEFRFSAKDLHETAQRCQLFQKSLQFSTCAMQRITDERKQDCIVAEFSGPVGTALLYFEAATLPSLLDSKGIAEKEIEDHIANCFKNSPTPLKNPPAPTPTSAISVDPTITSSIKSGSPQAVSHPPIEMEVDEEGDTQISNLLEIQMQIEQLKELKSIYHEQKEMMKLTRYFSKFEALVEDVQKQMDNICNPPTAELAMKGHLNNQLASQLKEISATSISSEDTLHGVLENRIQQIEILQSQLVALLPALQTTNRDVKGKKKQY